ncbi:MAG: hypothetical protein AAGI34_17950, partial [Pseudomonadota bacterium]
RTVGSFSWSRGMTTDRKISELDPPPAGFDAASFGVFVFGGAAYRVSLTEIAAELGLVALSDVYVSETL